MKKGLIFFGKNLEFPAIVLDVADVLLTLTGRETPVVDVAFKAVDIKYSIQSRDTRVDPK